MSLTENVGVVDIFYALTYMSDNNEGGNMIAKWFVIGYLFMSLVLYVTKIGKPREPITSRDAAFSVAEWVVLMGIVMVFWP
jgi:hypothetical protein